MRMRLRHAGWQQGSQGRSLCNEPGMMRASHETLRMQINSFPRNACFIRFLGGETVSVATQMVDSILFLWKVSRGCTQRQNTKSYSKIDIDVYVRHTRQWREPCSLENSPTCSVHRYCSGLSLSGLMSKILEFSNNKFLLITSPMDFLFHTSVLRDSFSLLLLWRLSPAVPG